jgi:hypothetical protein
MQLVLGDTYNVLDSLGQVQFAARFLGKAVNANRITDQLLVLERDDKRTEVWTLAGCELKCHVEKDGEVVPYLYATHYGNTIEELAPSGVPRRDPHWEIV